MDNAHQPKISLPEVIFVGALLFVFPDTLELMFAVAGIDDFGISDVIFFPAAQFYLRIKGVRGSYSLVMGGLEVIPYVGALPLRTIGFLVTAWLDHHPRTAGVASAIGTPSRAPRENTAGPREPLVPQKPRTAPQGSVGVNEETNEINLMATYT